MLYIQEPFSTREQAPLKHILVVECDLALGELLDLVISHETVYRAIRASHSGQVWDLIKQCKPSLFVLNYHLRDMNGIELYDRLHATPELATIPAIILTTNLAQHHWEIEQRHLIGLSMPLELDELIKLINKLVA